MSASPQQQINEWCRISQLQTWISPIKIVDKYETANWSLQQGDEEVNKRIKQKYIYLNKLPNISVWKQTFFRG